MGISGLLIDLNKLLGIHNYITQNQEVSFRLRQKIHILSEGVTSVSKSPIQ